LELVDGEPISGAPGEARHTYITRIGADGVTFVETCVGGLGCNVSPGRSVCRYFQGVTGCQYLPCKIDGTEVIILTQVHHDPLVITPGTFPTGAWIAIKCTGRDVAR